MISIDENIKYWKDSLRLYVYKNVYMYVICKNKNKKHAYKICVHKIYIEDV